VEFKREIEKARK
jgi:regulator of replication initiation timing